MCRQTVRRDGSVTCRFAVRPLFAIAALLVATPLAAQTPVAVDDAYGVGFASDLVVEAPGVIANDTYDGGSAEDAGATVTLIGWPSFGTMVCESNTSLDLCPDGSFKYTPGVGFPGFDTFTYEVAVGAETDVGTVTVTACTGGPTQYVCWVEAAYLSIVGQLGYQTISEGFEDDVVWGLTRDPQTEPSVTNHGVTWQTNHWYDPAWNELTTGTGPAWTGLWAAYDVDHGYAAGTPATCDVNNPTPDCVYKDGFTGTSAGTLYGVGGYFSGQAQPNLTLILDAGAPIGLGRLSVGGHQFFGVIDTAGFTTFRVEETDGKVGQERYVFGDDFTIATGTTDTTPPQVTWVGTYFDTGDGELVDGEVTDAAILQLILRFSEPVQDTGGLDPGDVSHPSNLLLFDDGGDGVFDTPDCIGGVASGDHQIPVDDVSFVTGSVLEATMSLNGWVSLPEGSYRLLACGTTSIRDWAGNALDGDGNGVGGDDFRLDFTVLFNDPPVADDQAVTTAEDTAKAITLTATDPDGGPSPLTYSIVSNPTHGGLTGTPPDVTYTPDADYFGPDSFTFSAFDGTDDSNTATVSITVTPVNDDPPTATDDGYATDEDTPLSVAAPGVLGNDSDPDGDTLTAIQVIGPSNAASFTLNTDGSFSYTPTADYNGPDSFTYKANDGLLDSNIATVTITVNPINDAPTATDDGYATDEDTPLTVVAPGVLGNDTDPEGDALTAIQVTSPSHAASFTLNVDGSFSYTPTAGYNGPDSFTYKANDGALDSNVATVTITVNPINDAPTATDDGYATDEDIPLSVAAPGVLGNDSDPEGDALTAIQVTGPAHAASFTLNSDGSFSYTPAANYHGSDSFTYTANDGALDSSVATVSITVRAVNDPPVADDQSVTTIEDTALPITLTATDVEGGGLSFSIVTPPTHGILSGTPPAVTYTPNTTYIGPDSFTFIAHDGSLDSNVATVSITVTSMTTTWFVATTGSDTNDCQSAATPCLTLQGAIAKAASGDTVSVAAGTYAVNSLIVDKHLSIVGAGITTVLDGGGLGLGIGTTGGASLGFRDVAFSDTGG